MTQRFNPPTRIPERLFEAPWVDNKGHLVNWEVKQFFQKMATPVQVSTHSAGTHAQRLAMDVGSLVSGSTFFENDRGVSYSVRDGVWYFSGGTMDVEQRNLPTDLKAGDAGFLVHVSDFSHLLRWTGRQWTWGPGETQSGFIAAYVNPPAENSGWVAADGSDNIPQLLGDGSIDLVTVPNVSGSYFRQ